MTWASATFGSRVFGSTRALFNGGVELFISGIDRSGLLTQETLKVRESLNARASASFQLVDTAGSYLPREGEPVLIRRDGLSIFKGSLESVDWTSGWTSGRFLTITCVNMARVLDRRLVAAAYESTATEDIVADIIATYLAADGITAGRIDAGPVLTKAVFNYTSAASVMDDICDLTGYSWYVDQFGQLNVQNRATTLAPWNITDDSAPVFNVKAKRSRQSYSNVEWLRAGLDVTDSRTDTFKGDGALQTFTLKFPAATQPTVAVNSVAKTVGIRGIDGDKDFYWNKNDKEVTQDDGATALSGTDTLEITYTGFYPLMVKVSDPIEISARRQIEAGSGIYERIDADSSLEDRDIAEVKANGLLRKFGKIAESVTYGSYTFGLRVGQLQSIRRTEDDINDEYLISETSMTWSASRNDWILSVTAILGEQLGGWQQFFKRLFASTTKFTIRENEVIFNPTPHYETVTLTDAVNTTDPAGDGSDDSLTTARVSDATEAVEKQFRVGKARLGRDYFS